MHIWGDSGGTAEEGTAARLLDLYSWTALADQRHVAALSVGGFQVKMADSRATSNTLNACSSCGLHDHKCCSDRSARLDSTARARLGRLQSCYCVAYM